MNEILVQMEIGPHEVVTQVVERNAQGATVRLGQGRADTQGICGVSVGDTNLLADALIQSLDAAEQSAKVDIRQVAIRSAAPLDMAHMRAVLRAISVDIVQGE